MSVIRRFFRCLPLLLTMTLALGACAEETVDPWDPAWASLEEDMLKEVNLVRAAGAVCGDIPYPPTHPLEMDTVIQKAARGHSLDMATLVFFSHDSPDGRSFSDRITEVGFVGAMPWGENIQAGSSTAKEAVAGLVDSPPHCENIMSPEFFVVGFGYAFDPASPFKHYWTQNFAASH